MIVMTSIIFPLPAGKLLAETVDFIALQARLAQACVPEHHKLLVFVAKCPKP